MSHVKNMRLHDTNTASFAVKLLFAFNKILKYLLTAVSEISVTAQ